MLAAMVLGGVFVVAGANCEAVVAYAGRPAWGGAEIVCRLGPRFPAAASSCADIGVIRRK